MNQRDPPHCTLQEGAVPLARLAGRGRVLGRVVDREDDAVVELRHPRDAVQVDTLQLRRPDLAGPPPERYAHGHEPQVAVDADDPVLPPHPLRGVVGDADDDLQMRRLGGARRRRRNGSCDAED